MSTIYNFLQQTASWLQERSIPHHKVALKNVSWVVYPDLKHRENQLLEYANAALPDNYSLYHSKKNNKSLLVVSESALSQAELGDIMSSTIDETGLRKKLSDALGECCHAWPTNGLSQTSPTITKGRKHRKNKMKINEWLTEALDGIAAEYQPGDILKMLGKAMQKLKMVEKLQAANVKVGVSRDNQFITFTKKTNEGGIPLVQFAVQDLAEPKNMEMALNQIIDIATGGAPGSGDLKREQLKKVEKAISHLSKQYSVAAQAQQAQAQADPAMQQVNAGI